ncbi:2-phosphosulfolactate phosphatase [Fretibacterium sp. OH1220_COT-178]|uniref:2-phosphosulfolactate phosphatase n=1 Tax=Fretibacterium sp. OH1220_COT-178 TaxID=2491047 RepID=UPI000F602A1B|nr:2-phosphosulfolactate phosphatase [Fretibacterium sp. OH1220_COT-178]RRD64699.1 2-phosphosulfolactate phosphatase [Fretibacterium sp. OH1220_COT-178]
MAKPIEADVVLSCSEHLPAVDVWLVVDVLRATTVIVRWFELGGEELYPVDSVESARRLAQALAQEGCPPLLMGEENAIAPRGFDLGNSPTDLTRELVVSRPCAVMATTNGTKALLKAAATGVPVLVACARNALSVLDCALSRGSRIGILCSGRKGRPAWDDTLCAGLLLADLERRQPGLRLADGARLALLAWQSSSDLHASLESADHAVFLNKIGYGADIAFACRQDATDVVPELHELPDEDGMRAVLRRVPADAIPPGARPPLPRTARVPAAPQGDRTAPTGADRFAPLLQYARSDADHVFLGGGRHRKGK